jgi:hypothetical protein
LRTGRTLQPPLDPTEGSQRVPLPPDQTPPSAEEQQRWLEEQMRRTGRQPPAQMQPQQEY